ncbi:MAG: glutaminyl-peptide cyclotransferase [Pseudomonadota bacterium]
MNRVLKNTLSALCALAALACTIPAAQAAIPVYGFIVKHTFPHDPAAFTQGLFFKDGVLYESTGLNGRSSVRKVELASGKVIDKHALPDDVFGEGIAEAGGELFSLTWTSHVGYVFDFKGFKQKRQFSYGGEGWGLTSDGHQLYMSDGSAVIRVLNPANFSEQRHIQVMAEGKPVTRLNELEWVDGQIFANVWGTDVIARIDPASGEVLGWIDLGTLLEPSKRGTESADAVLNGIAYDSKHHRLFVTGKLWPKLFEIELVRLQNR